MRVRITLLACMLVVASPVTLVSAVELDGWCLSADPCGGAMPIRNGHFTICEAECRLRNPVSVRDMDATLYDVICSGDSHPLSKERWFFSKYSDWQEKEHVVAVNPRGLKVLERCE